MIIDLIEATRARGATLQAVCRELGLDARTYQRWLAREVGDDRRNGPKTTPQNKLTHAERQEVVAVATSPKFRDLSPKQIVPQLADEGRYLASESTIYRVLRDEKLQQHRGRAKAPTPRPLPEQTATGPCQLWSWDITYLRSSVKGAFFYLYLYLDVWSRKIVGFDVHEAEDGELASAVLERALADEGASAKTVRVHMDNGAPMKAATFKATMERLGVVPSFSRPRVSDDNPFSESLFRTLKYRPSYPREPFATLDAARAWVADFVAWYNDEHFHSGIGFVTPASRHRGHDEVVLAARRRIYARAKARRPERWSRHARPWATPKTVRLHPNMADQLTTN